MRTRPESPSPPTPRFRDTAPSWFTPTRWRWRRIIRQGTLPVLMERGRFEASLRNDAPLKRWALALDGSRTEPLPLPERGGVKHIAIDTGKLKHGPAVFFELAAD